VRHYATLALLACLLLGTGTAARAQDKEQCVQAYEEAQSLRLERKFIEAKERLMMCTNARCPTVISTDCWRWLGEVEGATPAFTVAAETQDGGDVLEATVTLDGQELGDDWNGRAVPVNPGPHTLRAEAAGFHPTEQTVVAREGERARLVKLVLKPIAAAAPVGSEAPATGAAVSAPLEVEPQGRRLTWPVYTLGGVAVAAGGVGAYLGYSATQEAKDLDKECAPNCHKSDVDAARTKLIVANALFGVAGAAAVGALVTYLVSKPDAPESNEDGLALGFDMHVQREGGVAVLRGSY
jgi:hypothetical protein